MATSLYKCSRCGKFRRIEEYSKTKSKKRSRVCVYCSGISNSKKEESKGLIIRECGVCGGHMINPRNKGGWLCKKHSQKMKRNQGEFNSMCNSCPQLLRCQVRIKRALWVLCEMPDEGDIDRVKAMLNNRELTVDEVIDYTRQNY